MKHLIFIPLVLLLVACGTVPTPSPVEVYMTQQAAQIQACATLEAIGTPQPCNPPTATPQPTSTPTPLPTPTATPVTGWRQYTESGEYVRDMPPGWVPDCGGVVGCPGDVYLYYENGVPVTGTSQGTPGYWPYLIIGSVIVLLFVGVLAFGVYGSTAPQRALAVSMRKIGEAQAALLEAQARKALPDPGMNVPVHMLGRWLRGFISEHHPEREFEETMRTALSKYPDGNHLLTLPQIVMLISTYDKQAGSHWAREFGAYIEKVSSD